MTAEEARWAGLGPEDFMDDPCPMCGGPEPCSKRACMEALSAQADYAEGMIEGSDWPKK